MNGRRGANQIRPVFLGIKNITEDGRLDFTEIRHIAEQDFPTWTRRVLPQPGDIVFTYEATLNRYALIPLGFRGCLGRRLALIRPDPAKVYSRFLFYYFFGDEWRGTITRNLVFGSTVDRIPLVRFPDFQISVPPLVTQRKIAAILSAYDDLIENNTRRIRILEEVARALYREWFVNFRFPGHGKARMVDSRLGKVPEGWGRTLGDVLTLKRGYDLPEKARQSGTVPIVSSSGVTGYHNEAKAKSPGVVTGRYGTLGEVFYLREDFWPLNTTLYVRDFKENDPCLVKNMLETLNLAHQNAAGAVPGVNRNALHLLPVAFPPVTVQQMVAPTFLAINDCQHNLRAKNENLRRTRDLLLPKLVSGEVDVSELNIDAPAPATV